MNRTDIDWADYSWNPLSGCLHGCPYCYARRIATRFAGGKAFPNGFTPTWHPERLAQPLRVKKPSRIFAVSMGDPFGDWVEGKWIDAMFAVMRKATWHRFLLLTKRPQNIAQKLGCNASIPNVWLGATLTGVVGEIDPSSAMRELQKMGWHCFINMEPILGPIDPGWYSWAEWIVLGVMTGPGAVKTKWKDIAIERTSCPLFVKENLAAWYPRLHDVQEYPSGLKVHNWEV